MLPPRPPRISTPLDLQSNLIYGIPCLDCNSIYIGQTKQTLKARVNHHKSEFKHMCPNNSLVHHYIQTGHTPNFTALSKFYSQPNFRSRLNLEAICIAASDRPVSNHLLPQMYNLQSWYDLLKLHNICISPQGRSNTTWSIWHVFLLPPMRSIRLWCLLRSVAFLPAARLTALFVFSV